MPIKGLTDRGMAFPEIGQIRKGAKKGENRPGKDLTYFRVEFDEREQKAIELFRESYGEEPTAIRIILPFNEIDRMWDAWLEAYTAGRMVARSDGEYITYQVDTKNGEVVVINGMVVRTNQPEPHPTNNIAGYDYQKKPVFFKPSGRLKVIIPELRRAAYLTVLTTSKHDIANISNQLRAFQQLNNGVIAGIPFILRRSPKKISVPGKDGQRVRMTKWMLSIEVDPDWAQAKFAALPGRNVELLTAGNAEYEDPDPEWYNDDIEEGEYTESDVDENEPIQDPTETIEDVLLELSYPPELAVITNSNGDPYVNLPSDKLKHMRRAMARKLDEPNALPPDQRAQYEKKCAVIDEIIRLRE